jgi:ribonuclease BN (tRNA processing enzyme)
MAYLREEKTKIEIDYSIDKVWAAIPVAITKLEWKTKETDEANHILKVLTKKGFLAYESTLNVDLTAVNDSTTQVSISAETPVTTITSMADFGRTRDRIELFIEALALVMDAMAQKEKTAEKAKKMN